MPTAGAWPKLPAEAPRFLPYYQEDGVGPLFVNANEGVLAGSFFASNYVSAESFSDGNLTSLEGFTDIDPQAAAEIAVGGLGVG